MKVPDAKDKSPKPLRAFLDFYHRKSHDIVFRNLSFAKLLLNYFHCFLAFLSFICNFAPKEFDMTKNIAVVLAGGVGKRLGNSLPKQFLEIAGKMVIEHAVDAFEQNTHIDEIAIVSNALYLSKMEEIVQKNRWKKVKKILRGGKERYDSSLSAINAYQEEDVNLVFHDAARPLVSQRIIDDVTEALHHYDAATVAMPSADTIIEVDGDFIKDIPDRSRLRRVQTPQAFKIGTIRQAYDIALKDPDFKVTDDCGVVKRYLPGTPIFVALGEESNMKLTYQEDTRLLEMFIQMRQTT